MAYLITTNEVSLLNTVHVGDRVMVHCARVTECAKCCVSLVTPSVLCKGQHAFIYLPLMLGKLTDSLILTKAL